MEDIKKAYEVLGLEPFASKDLVEQRYDQALRKQRARAKMSDQNNSPQGNDSFDFNKITEAYRAILDYETKKYTEAYEQEEYGKYKNMAGFAKKLDHFWRYYKIHTFAAIGIIIAIVYGAITYMDKLEEKRYLASLPPVDLEISFFGNFYDLTEDKKYESVNAKFLADFPEYQRFETDLVLVPEDPSAQYAYLQKALIMLATESPDMYITDEAMRDYTMPQGLYVELDTIDALADVVNSPYAVKGAVRDVNDNLGEEHVFMVDLTESALADNLQMAYTKLLVGIRADTESLDKAIAFINHYAATLPGLEGK